MIRLLHSLLALPIASLGLIVSACGGDELGEQGDGGTSSSAGASSSTTSSTGGAGQGGSVEPFGLPPTIDAPDAVSVAEEEALSVTISVSDPDGDPVRVFVTGLPPGAQWDEPSRALGFTPDFIQGGHQWTVTITADDGAHRAERQVTITALDTISPPEPTIAKTEPMNGFTRLTLSQVTDTYLDSPGYAGRSFTAIVNVPDSPPTKLPVRVAFHGFDGTPWTEGWSGEYRIMPHDPMNSYWWGYADSLPGKAPGPGAKVPDYTLRRALHLLGWTLAKYPSADPERVYADGASMGGAGAAMFGLFHARHVSFINATIFQAIPRNHRPSRISQLTGLWGLDYRSRPAGRLSRCRAEPVRERFGGTLPLQVNRLWRKRGLASIGVVTDGAGGARVTA